MLQVRTVYRALGKQNSTAVHDQPQALPVPLHFISKEKRSKCKEHMSGTGQWTVELPTAQETGSMISLYGSAFGCVQGCSCTCTIACTPCIDSKRFSLCCKQIIYI
jgi:hypothetical protein